MRAAKTKKEFIEHSDATEFVARSRTNQDFVFALRGLERGDASKEQQILALKGIVDLVCAYHDDTFDVDPCISAYNAGKRSVGRRIVTLLKLNINKIKEKNK